MKLLSILNANPSLCSLVVACMGAAVSIGIALIGCLWSLHVSKIAIKAENDRLLGFHKLEVFENAIEEVNYLVPLYKKLRSESFEKRSQAELNSVFASLRTTIDAIVEYQQNHNAIGKAKIYSAALDKCVPFAANKACVDYIRKLDDFERNRSPSSKFSMRGEDGIPVDMYLADALSEYDLCADQLKEEIENLEFFVR